MQVLQNIPNCTIEMIETHIYKPFRTCALGIETEIAACVLEKSDAINLRELSCVKALLNDLIATAVLKFSQTSVPATKGVEPHKSKYILKKSLIMIITYFL